MYACFLRGVIGISLLLVLLPDRTAAQRPQLAATIYLPSVVEQTATATSLPPATTPVALAQLQAEVVRLVNVERAAAGCPAALPHPALMSAAQAWSTVLDRNGWFEHSPLDWYTTRGYPLTPAEDIHLGSLTAAGAVAAWMASPPHRQTLLSCPDGAMASYDIGVGFSNARWILALGSR